MLKWIRKRLTVSIIAPLVLTPLTVWLTQKVGMPEDMANDVALAVLAVIGVYVFGQSWTDSKLIEKGLKEQ